MKNKNIIEKNSNILEVGGLENTINRYKEINYFSDFCDYLKHILLCAKFYTVEPIAQTNLTKISLKKLVQEFEDPNFKNKSKEEIVELCKEVCFKLSKQISSIPNNVEMFNKRDYIENDIMCSAATKIYKNLVSVNHKKIKKNPKFPDFISIDDNEVGIDLLMTMLHELYHVSQHYNLKNYLEGKHYEKDSAYSSIQSIIIATISLNLFNDATYESLYFADLSELNANIFSIKIMQKLLDKKMFNNVEMVEEVINKKRYQIVTNYTKDIADFGSKIYNKNLKVLSNINKVSNGTLQLLDDYTENEIKTLKNFYNKIKHADLKSYKAKMMDEVLKIESDLNSYTLKQEDKNLKM